MHTASMISNIGFSASSKSVRGEADNEPFVDFTLNSGIVLSTNVIVDKITKEIDINVMAF